MEGLIGYAEATAMLDVPRLDQREALEIALRRLRAAMTRYQLAIELGERTGQSMPPEQRQEVEGKIRCLEEFVANPDPARPPCRLVEEALRSSKISGT